MTQVRISDEAQAQARILDTWWGENRPAAPALFAREFGRAVSLLGSAPEAGALFRRSAIPGVRRIVLQRSRNFVFYVFDRSSDTVHILAVWGGPRGTDPVLVEPR
jgi:plasmid stabilization system protein ParE